MTLVWWEKTVEYRFILELTQHRRIFLSAFDGHHERLADTALSDGNRWVLIEFKRDAKSIVDERAKFTAYAEAHKVLSAKSNHHHIVYGEESDVAYQPQNASQALSYKMVLCAQKYFGETASSAMDLLTTGADFKTFSEYVARFTHFKKAVGGASGGGGLTINDFSNVVGVNAQSKVVQCVSLREFIEQQPQLRLQYEHTLGRPSRGRDFGPSR